MAKIKYDPAETPLLNEHLGYTFQPNRYGFSMFPSGRNSRTRYTRQIQKQNPLMKCIRNWRDMSGATQTAWNNFAAAYPQPSKADPTVFLSGYQLFLKRNQYQFLNYGIDDDFIYTPTMEDLLDNPITFELKLESGALNLYYTFNTNDDKYLSSVFMSKVCYPTQVYPGTRCRYMGVIQNSNSFIPNYGLLYNAFAVNNIPSISAPGFHVPSLSDFNTLISFLGGSSLAGGHLKETGFTHWLSPNVGANNSSGFTARGTGQRQSIFTELNKTCRLWSSTFSSPIYYFMFSTYYQLNYASTTLTSQQYGLALHLIKNDSNYVPNYIGNNGVIYDCVQIGSQVWTVGPLIETKFSDGTLIPLVTDQTTWNSLSTPAYCYFGNDISNAYSAGVNYLDITENYLMNFGILPQVGDYVLFKHIPMAANSGQFFEEESFILEVQ